MISPCGEYEGEVLVDGDGVYLGDFTHGYGIETALGFTQSGGMAWPVPPLFVNTVWDASQLIGARYWTPPEQKPIIQPDLDVNEFHEGCINASLVGDLSGPVGLEDLPAVQVRGAGASSAWLAFVGAANSLVVGAGDPAAYSWHPAVGSSWVAQGWVRTVADQDDYLGIGNHVGFGYLWAGWGGSPYYISIADITADWTFFQHTFTVQASAFGSHAYVIPAFGIMDSPTWPVTNRITFWPGTKFETTQDRTFLDAHGLYLFKCLHLYPEGAAQITEGVHVHRRF